MTTSLGQQSHLRLSSPQIPPPVLQGGIWDFPMPARRNSPSSVSWFIHWASSWLKVPGKPPSRGHLKTLSKPPQPTPLDMEEKQLYSEPLLDVRALQAIIKAVPKRFQILDVLEDIKER